ncbi:hypothetical protein CRD60_05345 [Bifidobacterium aemilianum]|uniref:GTPase n=1 Tax=Bifidobacterium aemilianum TaxID=2493120 RepID=A0A366K7M4_9BIFI|nr:hypothetical protein [Bifidobacterium aemilianum]RBP97664.1 hypothetical protein CRD60_05345 [Bifidobacterium aemilianum]
MTDADTDRGESRKPTRPSRHAVIMRGLVAPFFGILAVASIVLGCLNATVWKPSSEIRAQARVAGARYIATDPKVLTLVDEQAELKVTGPSSSQEVCIALGSPKDVAGWTAGKDYVRITGLQDWASLSTHEAHDRSQAKGVKGQDVAFKDSDMWTRVRCGKGSARMNTTSADADRVALIYLGKNANTSSSARVSLHWVRHSLPDFATPFYFVGALFVVLTVLSASVFAMPPHKRRKRELVSTATPVQEEVSIKDAVTGSLYSLKEAASLAAPGKSAHMVHRHGRVDAGGDTPFGTPAATGPVVHDPGNRNLPAEQSQELDLSALGIQDQETAAPEPEGVGEETTLISQNEFDEYLARLAAEETESADDGAEEGGQQ